MGAIRAAPRGCLNPSHGRSTHEPSARGCGRCLLPLAVVAPAHAATTSVVCDSAWTGRTVDANVVVPAGTWCQLHEVTVSGNVTVQSGATLHAYGKSAIAGNIFSDGGAVSVHDSSVGGT